LRGRGNILKRLLIHVAAFNLSLLMRQWLGAGTPRGFAALVRSLESIVAAFETGVCALIALWCPSNTLSTPNASIISIRKIILIPPSIRRRSTGC
jgi:transposase